MDNEIVEVSKSFAKKLLSSDTMSRLSYHNLAHTQYVVEACLFLSEKLKLSEHDHNLLQIAAWFHDLGYSRKAMGHEAISIELAGEFLKSKSVSDGDILEVKGMILATDIQSVPANMLQELIRDADSAHLASDNYFVWSERLRKETAQHIRKPISSVEWLKLNIAFFENHKYFTDAAKKFYRPGKSRNLLLIENQLESMSDNIENNPKTKSKKSKKNKVEKQSRGVETMFRVTLKNHTALSRIADNKANIMLSINAIIVSIILTSLLPKLDNNTYLIWPSILLLTVCIISIIFATISTIPKVTGGKTDRATVQAGKANLLFFGNFHNMKLEDYTW